MKLNIQLQDSIFVQFLLFNNLKKLFMELIFIGSHSIDNQTKLDLISKSEPQIYIPSDYNNCFSYLKKGSVVWVRKDTYNVYELTEDITAKNEKEFIESIISAENFWRNR